MSEKSALRGTKDWHSSKQIGKRARYLLEHPDEQIPSDVTFLVGNGQDEPQKVFKCHKFILAMVSSMFQAMFYASFPHTEDIIKIPDVTPTAFQHMLRYAYGENVGLDSDCTEDLMDTLYCAKKYLIPKMVRACRDLIQHQIVALAKDPYAVLQSAPQIDEDDLANLALDRIAMYTANAMRGDSFPRLSFDCVKIIVDYAHLNAKEIDIYHGVRRWVEHNVGVVSGSALREAFGSLLYSIRFPLFSATELADGPLKDGVLTADEASSFFQFFFAQIKPTLPFLTAPRIPLETPIACCFELVTAPASAPFESFATHKRLVLARPELAPECCAYLRQLVDGKLHIRIASFDNEHSGKTAPLPAALAEEGNVVSHSVKGACWSEWDMEEGTACNVRIGVGRKPHLYHSAVWGFAMGLDMTGSLIPFTSWNDNLIQSVANFRLLHIR